MRAVVCAMACTAALIVSMPCQAQSEPKDTAKVFVCTGSAAYAYHTHRDCRGLNRCTATIKQTTAKAARKEGRNFCGYCRGRHTLPISRDITITKSEEIL